MSAPVRSSADRPTPILQAPLQSRISKRRLALTVWVVLVLIGLPVWAGQVTVPLLVDLTFLRQLLLAQVYADADQTARVWDDGSGCNFLVLSNPRVDAVQGRLRVTSDGVARIGTALGGGCLVLLNWRGMVEVDQQPRIEPNSAVVHFQVVGSNIYGPDGSKQPAVGKLWDWIKQYVHPRLAQLTIDLRPIVTQLRELLPTVFPDASAGQIDALLNSLSLTDVSVADKHVALSLRVQPPEVKVPTPAPGPEPVLTPDQVAHFNAVLDQWDAFLTHTIMYAAADTDLEELRFALLKILLDARYDLLQALAGPVASRQDPVRSLFVKAWDELSPALRHVGEGLPGTSGLRYIAFISAADALRALDTLGPQVNLELSANGLRRLARILAPDKTVDPLGYSLDVDPGLRQLFGFGPPLPFPQDNPMVDPLSWLFHPAWAGTEPNRELVARLSRWVPEPDELHTYLPMVRDLLNQTAEATLPGGKLEQAYYPLFRNLVPATAWQETCWRQFIRVGKKIEPLRSAAGSVGIMQVNQRVWRGFYDVKGLRTDISYNARAGSEILLHYLVDYAIKKGEQRRSGSTDNLARATYAMYNGGPRQLSRYRKANTPESLKKIDALFWEKYRAIKSGDELGVIRCYGKSSIAEPAKASPKESIPAAPPIPSSRRPPVERGY